MWLYKCAHTMAGNRSIIFVKVWITYTRDEVYMTEHLYQVLKVYDY